MFLQSSLCVASIALLSSLAATFPSSFSDATLFARAGITSPDNTCGTTGVGGSTNGYTCIGATIGECCSVNGFCGSNLDYCGDGCQADFGTCNSTAPPGDDGDDMCGPDNENRSCTGADECCSIHGFCGTDTAHCAATNCNPDFGICNPDAPGSGDVCGPDNDNQVCGNGECCSPAGFCGTTEDYCESPDCLSGFGVCDSDKTPSGESTINIPRPDLGDVPYGEDIVDCTVSGTIGMTFDDGPYIYTSDLLDLLKANNATATFFVTGNNLGKGEIDDPSTSWPALLQRMIAEGHQIASHTWSHYDLSTLNETTRTGEMVKNEMAFRNVIGKIPTYMRPPYSSCDDDCRATMKTLGYHIIYFDFDTDDYDHDSPDLIQISKDWVTGNVSLVNSATDNLLSIEHDIHQQTVYNLTQFYLDTLKSAGFRAVTAGECLGDPIENWYRDASSGSSSSSSSTQPTATPTPTSSTTSVAPISTTTTSSPTSSSTSHTSTSTSTSTSHTSTSTSTKPAQPTSTCATFQVNKFCANPIKSFTTKSGCTSAVSSCNQDVLRCQIDNILSSASGCTTFKTNWCTALSTYCSSTACTTKACDSTGFTPKA